MCKIHINSLAKVVDFKLIILIMSLFKVRDFWSFDLNHLWENNSDNCRATSPTNNWIDDASPPDDTTTSKAQFIVSIGRFSSIGEQDVFVCGDLEGHIYIIQVPESDQKRFIKSGSGEGDATAPSTASGSPNSGPISSGANICERQLLAATHLSTTLIDLKCGYFTSALKQSIAALCWDKLIIMTVKRHQMDLMTGPDVGASARRSSSSKLLSLDENLFSHQLEEFIRLDLMRNELAYGVIVMNNHADSSLVDSNKPNTVKGETDLSDLASLSRDSRSKTSLSLFQATKQVVQQLHLPQRDKIVVQYANQFVFTVIDGKKVVGHFRVTSSPSSLNPASDRKGNQSPTPLQSHNELRLNDKSQYFGSMPMAHLITGQKSAQSLIISLSDHCIYCLPMDKLTSQARQNIVNRVALDLLSSSSSSASRVASSGGPDPMGSSSLNRTVSSIKDGGNLQTATSSIEINLESLSEWHHELGSLPIQMQGLQRQARGAPSPVPHQPRERMVIGQLLVMSRYSLDLFASSGEHLWHQRFEVPLICLHAYTIESSPPAESKQANTGDEQPRPETAKEELKKQQIALEDQIVSLVCSDGLSDDRSNLMILKDDRMSWSAVLSSRPFQVWRMSLNRMSGLIAMLDIRQGQLIASYLGTNLNHSTGSDDTTMDELGTMAQNEGESDQLVELERLNEPLFQEDRLTLDHLKDDQRKRLLVANQIEMGPGDGIVIVCTSIRLEPNSTSVVHNIVVAFEFDDLFKFDLVNCGSGQNFRCPARGVAEVLVGNCWPDRREPLRIEASFSLLSACSGKLVGVAAMNQFNDTEPEQYQAASSSRLMPKSLKVHQYLTFNETHSGSLHQEEAFLLPMSVVAQLTHVDYTSGQGQDLGDVLNNLNGYKRGANNGPTMSPYLYCDLFLGLNGDLITLLHDFIEGDLICRGRNMQSSRSTGLDTNKGNHNNETSSNERRVETMESINMLAQSLDCRIRYMSPSPSGIDRQSSEELVQPVMISFALILRYSYPKLFDLAAGRADQIEIDDDDERIVWIHICDLSSSSGSNIVTDFISLHIKGWKDLREDMDGNEKITSDQVSGQEQNTSKLLISIESQQPMAAVFVLDHLTERVTNLCNPGARLSAKLIGNFKEFDIQRDLIDGRLSSGSFHLAISSTLHEALVSILNAHETDHKPKLKQLQLDLTKEFCKYEVATDSLLSLSKRLPSLPDDMSNQLNLLVTQAKESQLRLASILDELDKLKRLDFELFKLPAASMIRLELPRSSNLVAWSGLDQSFD